MALTLTPVTAGSLSLPAAPGLGPPSFVLQEGSGRWTLESGAGFIILEDSTGISFDPALSVSLSLVAA